MAQQPTTQNIQLATQKYEEGEIHYQLQEWEKALEKYKEAYRLTRSPEMLFNIGQCYRMLKKYDEAIKSYKAFQRELPNSPQHDSVTSLIKLSEEELKKQQAASQATSQPATQTVVIREIAATQPKLPEPDEKMDGATKLYIASVGAMAGSFLFGGLALSSRIEQDQFAANEDATEFAGARKQALAMGVLSDTLAVAAFGVGAISYKKSPKKRTAYALYGLSASSLVMGVSCGATALSASKRAATSSDPVDSRFQSARANDIGNAADLLFVTAALAGGLGVVLQLKTPKQEVIVTPTVGGVSVSKKF
jgi:hypothetical protein